MSYTIQDCFLEIKILVENSCAVTYYGGLHINCFLSILWAAPDQMRGHSISTTKRWGEKNPPKSSKFTMKLSLIQLIKPRKPDNQSWLKKKKKKKKISYLPFAISFFPRNPKKGPWSVSSSFFCLKYSWSSLAFCLWNSKVITFLSSNFTWAAGLGGGATGEDGGEGGTGFKGVGGDGGEGSLRGGATGLLIGPSAWELLMVTL